MSDRAALWIGAAVSLAMLAAVIVYSELEWARLPETLARAADWLLD